jgi:hypothetical protein
MRKMFVTKKLVFYNRVKYIFSSYKYIKYFFSPPKEPNEEIGDNTCLGEYLARAVRTFEENP